MYDGGFDRREQREMLAESVQDAGAFVGAFYLLVSSVSEDAAPVNIVFDFIKLKTRPRVCAKRLDLATGQRVDVSIFTFDEVVDRDDVGFSVYDATETGDPTASKQFMRFTCA